MIIESPVGPLLLAANEHGLTHLLFAEEEHARKVAASWQAAERAGQPQPTSSPVARATLAETTRQLVSFFAGTRTTFNLPLAPTGTAFQQRVWTALARIPYGTTCSYGALATQLQQPRAVRAVGLANGHNPISIVVPCHRVIGANGTLTGYGGGLHRKQFLLELERQHSTNARS